MSKEGKSVLAIVLIVVGIIAFFALNPIVIVSAGQRGVVLKLGAVQDEILDEGWHWVMPIVKNVKKIDVTIQKEERGASASSKDLQIVTSKVAVNYRPDALKVNKLYQEFKREYNIRVIEPTIAEFVKKTTAQYTAEELITKRDEVKENLKTAIAESLINSYILVEDIFITDFDFSDEFNKSIEAKVRAEQEALKAKNDLERVKMEAEQKITQAKADAEAIRIQAQAITQQGGKDYVNLQWIKAWQAGGAQVPQFITSDSSGGFIFNMNK